MTGVGDRDPTRTVVGTGSDPDAVRNDLLAAWLDDCGLGRERTLEQYQSLFPGHEALIAEEYRLLCGGIDLPPRLEGTPIIPEVEILDRIGSGGQGVVYRGRQPYLDREVAVKILSPTIWSDAFASRFQREAKTLAALRHPNIVACYQAGITDSGLGYLVMEFVDGPNLREWIAGHGAMPEAIALQLCHDLARALAHAHESGIIHRDVKPENVLLQPRRGGDAALPFEVKLADLGLARSATRLLGGDARSQLTPAGAVLGSPRTMAPEQFDDPEGVDFRADVYGLGCVLYHAIAGRPAFAARTLTGAIKEKVAGPAPDLRAIARGVRPEVADLVAEMLAADPERRPASHDAVAERCRELLGGTGAGRRGRRAAAVTIVLLLALVATYVEFGVFALPEVKASAATRTAGEGETVVLRASDLPGLTYRWRELTDSGVPLSGAGAAAVTFVAPRGRETTTYRFEVTVSNGWRDRSLPLAVTVTPDPALAPIPSGETRAWFDPDEARIVDGWRRSEVGTWGPTEHVPPRARGYSRRGTETSRARFLPRGAFRIEGDLAPLLVNRPEALGIRLRLSPDRLVELAVRPRESGWLAGVALDGTPIGAVVPGSWSEAAPLGFRVDWTGGVLSLHFGTGPQAGWAERRLDAKALGTAFPPHELSLWVAGGAASFGRAAVSGR